MGQMAVDELGQLPGTSRENRYMLVAIDYFTNWPEAYPLPDQEATTRAEALVQGMNFESQVFAAMCSQLGIHETRTTLLHPQSDGLVEWFMRTSIAQLALTTAPDQSDWDFILPPSYPSSSWCAAVESKNPTA